MYRIEEYGCLNDQQRRQAVEVFMEGFGHMMTFSKDEEAKRKLFFEIFHPSLFKCYVKEEKVLGLLGLATKEVRPLKFHRDVCIKYFGKLQGTIISKQMNAIFQAPMVASHDELYVDVLVTGSDARRQGVATALLNYASCLQGYDTCFLHVFSQNQRAINLYEKNGFEVDKREKMSMMRFLGEGYPIRMRKTIVK